MKTEQYGALNLVISTLEEIDLVTKGHHRHRLIHFFEWSVKYARTRGTERMLCVEFPKIGKALDKSLSDAEGEFVPPIGTFPSAPKKKDSDWYMGYLPPGAGGLLQIMYRDIGGRYYLHHEIDPNIVLLLRTLFYGFKKLKLQAPASVVENDRKEFVSLDREVRSYVHARFEDGHYVPFREAHGLQEMVEAVARFFVPSQEVVLEDVLPRHGPGATSDMSPPRDKFNFEFWPRRLDLEFPAEFFSRHSEIEYLCQPVKVADLHLVGKLDCVPKSLDKTRVITVEPTVHQFIQQGMRRWLIERSPAALRACYKGSDQTLSQEAARLASIDGSQATIDLKSASDRLSLALVELIFASNTSLCRKLSACRTEYIDPGVGQQILLAKYAGQGNATTFHVQSTCYATLCVAAMLWNDGVRAEHLTGRAVLRAARRIRIYGDDIIVPSQYVASLALTLNLAGLRINRAKTHTEGFFREACGGDFYKGYDVAPLYFTYTSRADARSPAKLVSLCEVRNNAYRKGLFRICKMLDRFIPKKYHTYCLPGAIGFTSHLGLPYSQGGCRWNEALSRIEYRAHSLVTRSKMTESGQRYGRLYKWFVEEPPQDDNWCGSLTVSNRLRIEEAWVPCQGRRNTHSHE